LASPRASCRILFGWREERLLSGDRWVSSVLRPTHHYRGGELQAECLLKIRIEEVGAKQDSKQSKCHHSKIASQLSIKNYTMLKFHLMIIHPRYAKERSNNEPPGARERGIQT
jgi:hypothetical protein